MPVLAWSREGAGFFLEAVTRGLSSSLWRLATEAVKNANPVSLLILALTVALAGCDAQTAPVAPPSAVAPKTVADWFTFTVGGRTVRAQVAVYDAEMQRGLMERRDLGPDEGMLFVYRVPQAVSFWMRNTPTPLDIAYFTNDGVMAEVYAAFPFDETSIPSRSTRVQFVLEMHQGWYQRNGLAPGARLGLGEIAAALEARGFNAEAYGLAAAGKR